MGHVLLLLLLLLVVVVVMMVLQGPEQLKARPGGLGMIFVGSVERTRMC